MNSLYIKSIFGIFLMILGLEAFAQRDAMYTHYMYNTQVVNPAYVGSRHAFTVTALHRSQWASYFPGNPVTQSLTMHSPLRNEKIGLGLAFYNDELGPERTTALNVDFSYSVLLTEASKLSFGIKGGVRMHAINLMDLAAVQPDDPAIVNNYESLWLPNFGFGAYYSRERFYAGFSIPALMEENFFDNTVNSGARHALLQRHYYLIAGTIFPISNDISLKPTTLVKMTKGAPIELDFTASFYFYDRFSLGAMFRTQDAVGALVGFKITDQWSLGYSYDWAVLNRIPNNNFGTHEVFLRYDFLFLESHRVRSPRHF